MISLSCIAHQGRFQRLIVGFPLVDGLGEVGIDLVGQERPQGISVTGRKGRYDHLEGHARTL